MGGLGFRTTPPPPRPRGPKAPKGIRRSPRPHRCCWCLSPPLPALLVVGILRWGFEATAQVERESRPPLPEGRERTAKRAARTRRMPEGARGRFDGVDRSRLLLSPRGGGETCPLNPLGVSPILKRSLEPIKKIRYHRTQNVR